MKRPLCVFGFSMLFTLFTAGAIQNKQAIGAAVFAVLIAFVLSMCVRRTRKDKTVPLACFASLLALALLFCAEMRYTARQAAILDQSQAEISASLADLPYSENGRYYALLRVHTVNGEKTDMKIRLVCREPQEFTAHDTFYMTVKPFLLGEEGNRAIEAYYRAKGIVCGAFVRDEMIVAKQTQTDLFSYILSFRAALCTKMTERIGDEAVGVLAAMSLGARGLLPNHVENAFRAAGISHLLAVSGLHLTTWTMVLYELLKYSGVRRKRRTVPLLLFILFFAVLTGGSPSVLRAAMTTGTVYAAACFRREADAFNSLGLALIAMLFGNPFAARDLSLLLSVTATSGILLFANPLKTVTDTWTRAVNPLWLQTALRSIFSVLTVTASASVCTLPVQMWAFGAVSLAAFPANFLCLSVGSIAMVCGTVGALFSLLHLSALGQGLLYVSSLAAKWLISVTAWFSENGNVLLPVDSNFSKILLVCIFLGCAVCLCLNTVRRRFLRGAATVTALVFLLCNFSVYFARENRLQMTVCAVGEGVATVLHTKNETVLLCSGGDYFAESEICGILSAYGATHLDALFLLSQNETQAETGLSLGRQYPVGTVYYANTLKEETLPVGENRIAVQKSVVRFAGGELTVCVQQIGQYAYAKILYGDFCALISFCDTNNFYGDCADVLVCTKVPPQNMHPADFSLTVMSTASPSAADFLSVLDSRVCTTAENGSISFCISANGTFDIIRRG